MTHQTLQTFGYPETLLGAYEHWCVLLRPKQATLGALVLVAKSDVTAFSELPSGAFEELGRVTQDIEHVLGTQFRYEKINYLMLMMKDPQVHFHVLPRYSEQRVFADTHFNDPGWPGPPDLGHVNDINDKVYTRLLQDLRTLFETL
jgi:diadenosine tetraphosphate (Ap4A) HIT family hydrolase